MSTRTTTTRDDFYGICAGAAALILAVALAVPASDEPATAAAGWSLTPAAEVAQLVAGSIWTDAR